MKLIYRLYAFALAALLLVMPSVASATNLYVHSSALNLRATPSTSAPVVGHLGYGVAVTELGPAHGGWYEVRTSGGQVGYVSAQFVGATAPAPHAVAHAAHEEMVWLNTNSMVYHNSGCRWYENTEEGKLVPVSEARREGGRACEKCGG